MELPMTTATRVPSGEYVACPPNEGSSPPNESSYPGAPVERHDRVAEQEERRAVGHPPRAVGVASPRDGRLGQRRLPLTVDSVDADRHKADLPHRDARRVGRPRESPPTPIRRELPDKVAVRIGDHHVVLPRARAAALDREVPPVGRPRQVRLLAEPLAPRVGDAAHLDRVRPIRIGDVDVAVEDVCEGARRRRHRLDGWIRRDRVRRHVSGPRWSRARASRMTPRAPALMRWLRCLRSRRRRTRSTCRSGWRSVRPRPLEDGPVFSHGASSP